MKISEDIRKTIKILVQQGQTPAQIKHIIPSTVSWCGLMGIIKRLAETGSTDDRKRSGRPRSIRTNALKKKIKNQIVCNPRRSARLIAKQLEIKQTTVRRVIKDHLGLVAFRPVKVHYLNDAEKQRRKVLCNRLSRRFPKSCIDNILFSDEKIFRFDDKLIPQNERIYAKSSKDIPDKLKYRKKKSFPRGCMVWGGISAKGKTRLIFVDDGVKINTTSYIEKILQPIFKFDIPRIFGADKYIFQQDSAPSHKSKKSQQFLTEKCEFIEHKDWPSNSPDLNPMDYFVWGTMEMMLKKKKYRTFTGFKKSIKAVWEELPQDQIVRACREWYTRLKMVKEHDGGWIEKY